MFKWQCKSLIGSQQNLKFERIIALKINCYNWMIIKDPRGLNLVLFSFLFRSIEHLCTFVYHLKSFWQIVQLLLISVTVVEILFWVSFRRKRCTTNNCQEKNHSVFLKHYQFEKNERERENNFSSSRYFYRSLPFIILPLMFFK